MIESILIKTRMQSTRLRGKAAPSRFLALSHEIEHFYRKPRTLASSVQALTLKDRIYSIPFTGYAAKLAVSVIKLPVRLKQIYEQLESLQINHNRLHQLVSTFDNRIQNMSDVVHGNNANVSILMEMNHKVHMRVDQFEARSSEKIQRIQESCSLLERDWNRPQQSSDIKQPIEQYPINSAFYAAFERRFRSSSESLYSHLQSYLEFLPQLSGSPKAVDLGCGRGEWLSILKTAGYHVKGVDINATTNSLANAGGVEVEEADALRFLEDQPRASLDVISSFHLIEHVEPGYLVNLIQQAFRALKPGGTLILETPNPENLVVGSCNFHMDPTHRKPIPPALLSFMAEYAGFENIDCRRYHPGMKSYDGSDSSITDMNHFFSVGQDYAIIAKKPNEPKDLA